MSTVELDDLYVEWAPGYGAKELTPEGPIEAMVPTAIGPPVNAFTGRVGHKFTTGSAPVLVTALGRWVVSGNTSTHVVALHLASTSVLVTSVTVITLGKTSGRIEYTDLVTPVTLTANTDYYLVSNEVSAGDQYTDVTVTGAERATTYFHPRAAAGFPQAAYSTTTTGAGPFILPFPGVHSAYAALGMKFGASVWSRIPNALRSVNTTRGTPRRPGRLEPGESVFVFENLDRSMDPFNRASPLIANLVPKMPVRLRGQAEGETLTLWRGQTTDFLPGWEAGDGWCTMRARDRLAVLQVEAPDTIFEVELANMRPDYWWKLQEGGGLVYRNDGAIASNDTATHLLDSTGSATLYGARPGITFKEGTSYIAVPNLKTLGKAVTVVGVCTLTADELIYAGVTARGNVILSSAAAGLGGSYLGIADTGAPTFNIEDAGGLSQFAQANVLVQDKGPFVIIGRYDGANIKCQANGFSELVATASTKTPSVGSSRIGNYMSATPIPFRGRLNHVAVFRRVLTAGEVSTLTTAMTQPRWFDFADQRIAELLTLAGIPAAAAGAPMIDSWMRGYGETDLGPSTAAEQMGYERLGGDCLALIERSMNTEGGLFFLSRSGVFKFYRRGTYGVQGRTYSDAGRVASVQVMADNDRSFETSVAGWAPDANCTLLRDSAFSPPDGAWSMRLTRTGGASGSCIAVLATKRDCSPGVLLECSARIKGDGTAKLGQVGAAFYNFAGAEVLRVLVVTDFAIGLAWDTVFGLLRVPANLGIVQYAPLVAVGVHAPAEFSNVDLVDVRPATMFGAAESKITADEKGYATQSTTKTDSPAPLAVTYAHPNAALRGVVEFDGDTLFPSYATALAGAVRIVGDGEPKLSVTEQTVIVGAHADIEALRLDIGDRVYSKSTPEDRTVDGDLTWGSGAGGWGTESWAKAPPLVQDSVIMHVEQDWNAAERAFRVSWRLEPVRL